jgi:hypothetical protein
MAPLVSGIPRGGIKPKKSQASELPMAAFGNLTLLVSFLVATLAGVTSFVGIRRGSERLLRAGRAAVYLLATTLSMAIAAMVHAFTSSDFSIKYVQHYSEAGQPFGYKLTAVWGGLDGSLLFWVFLLAICSAIAVKSLVAPRARHYRLRHHRAHGHLRLLHLPRGLREEPVRHLPGCAASDRARPESAFAESRTWWRTRRRCTRASSG